MLCVYPGGLKLHPLYTGEAFDEDIHQQPKRVDLEPSNIAARTFLRLRFLCISQPKASCVLQRGREREGERDGEFKLYAIARDRKRFYSAIFTLDS